MSVRKTIKATNSLGCVAMKKGSPLRLYWRAHFNDRLIRIQLVAYDTTTPNKGAAVIRHLERLVAILRTSQTTTTERTGT